MLHHRQQAWLASILLMSVGVAVGQDDEKPKKAPQVYPAAIFAFEERGRETKDLGTQVSDLLFANLAAEPTIYLVDRADLKKLLEEQELNLSGLVNPTESTRVGQLTGAKLIITGSVLQVQDNLYLIAKIIGTETSRVIGASSKGSVRDDLDELVVKLAGEITKAINDRSGELVATSVSREDRVAALNKAMGKKARPIVKIKIEERHIGQATIDPAAETEFTLLCTETGFEVLDPDKAATRQPDILITGEGISEFATRHGNLISVKARLEVKAVERSTGRIVAADRQVAVEVDLSEQIAGKSALQEAAAEIAERMLPKIIEDDKALKPDKKNE